MYWIDKVFITIVFVLIASFTLSLFNSDMQHSKLMKQCMDDGHKEYECHGILKE